MSTALLLAALALAPASTRVEVGLRTEARAGVLRDPNDVDISSSGAVLQLNPAVLLEVLEGSFELRSGYAMNLGLRGSLGGFGTFSSHSVALSVVGGDEDRGLRPFANVSVFFGNVDFTDAGQKLQQPFGLGDEEGILPVLFAGTSVGASSRPHRQLLLRSSANLQLAAVPEDAEDPRDLTASRPSPVGLVPLDPLASRPFDQRIRGDVPARPVPDVLEPQLLPELLAEARYDVSRRDVVELEARFSTALRLQGPTYGAIMPSVQYTRRLTRAWSTDARAGLLFGTHLGVPGESREVRAIWPLFDVGISGETRPARLGVGRWSARVSMLPFYDPFIGALTQRLVVGGSTQWSFARDVEVVLGAQSYSLIGLLGTEAQARRVRDDHILALSGGASWYFLKDMKVEAGVIGSLRGKNPVLPVSRYVTPELLAYVALSAGFPVVQDKERRVR